MSYDRMKQECKCGNDTYHIQLLRDGNQTAIVASCVECRRITGSLGDGTFYGMDVGVLTE